VHGGEEVTEVRTRRPACPKPPGMADTLTSFTSASRHASAFADESGPPRFDCVGEEL